MSDVVMATAWTVGRAMIEHAVPLLALAWLAVEADRASTRKGQIGLLAVVVVLIIAISFRWGASEWLVQHRIFGKSLP